MSKITYTNLCGLKTTGYIEAQLDAGLTVLDLVNHRDRDYIYDLLRNQIKSNSSRKIPMLFYFSPILKYGKAIGLRGVGVDITERKRAEKELSALFEEKNVKFYLQKPEFNDTLGMDREKVMQVVRNLLTNALKFSPELSTVRVTIVDRIETLLVSIADEGVGIPDDKLDYVFGKFTQIKGKDNTQIETGLGLAICQKIISDHHGEIWAENGIAKGAIFGRISVGKTDG